MKEPVRFHSLREAMKSSLMSLAFVYAAGYESGKGEDPFSFKICAIVWLVIATVDYVRYVIHLRDLYRKNLSS